MITDHFSLGEFYSRDGSPYPGIWIADRLRPLCQQLEILRSALDRPITIISGYRSPAHNAAVGGATKSQHMEGRAADIRVLDMDAGLVHAKVLELYQQGTMRIGGLGRYKSWVHLDIRTGPRLAQWVGAGLTQDV